MEVYIDYPNNDDTETTFSSPIKSLSKNINKENIKPNTITTNNRNNNNNNNNNAKKQLRTPTKASRLWAVGKGERDDERVFTFEEEEKSPIKPSPIKLKHLAIIFPEYGDMVQQQESNANANVKKNVTLQTRWDRMTSVDEDQGQGQAQGKKEEEEEKRRQTSLDDDLAVIQKKIAAIKIEKEKEDHRRLVRHSSSSSLRHRYYVTHCFVIDFLGIGSGYQLSFG